MAKKTLDVSKLTAKEQCVHVAGVAEGKRLGIAGAKKTANLEQYEFISLSHPSIQEVLERFERDEIAWDEKRDLVDGLANQTGYKVTRLQNTLEPKVGSWLCEGEVDDLIQSGYTVNITTPKATS